MSEKPLPDKPLTDKQLWQQEEAAKKREDLVVRAVSSLGAYDGDVAETEIKSDWDQLIRVAKLRMPEQHALKFNLTPKKRVACMARALGWTLEKIAVAAGVSGTLIGRWLAEDQAKEFIKAIEYHSGSRDARELIDSEQFNSIMALKDLRDDPLVNASTRADIAKWFFETKHGKAKETKELTKINLRDLNERLNKIAPVGEAIFDLPDELRKPN